MEPRFDKLIASSSNRPLIRVLLLMSTDKKSKEYLDNLRHSTAHLLAAAVMELWPGAKRTIGPAIDNGFYFDFDFGNTKISDEDLPKIEDTMRQILKSWKGFERHELSAEDAKKEYPGNNYKHELIDEFAGKGEVLTFYKSGDYWDLCRGGHVMHPDDELKHFKLLSIAGAYWRGDEKNTMLTRIYGTVFPTKQELDDHMNMLEEAKKRDHKKLGPQLDLFMFHETSPGSPYWLPKGMILLNTLLEFWRVEHAKRGYHETATPIINKKELWETSGHWEHYKNDMFIADMGKNEVYGIKAMNCPNAMIIFGSKNRSYRDLPLRFSDSDVLHRYEMSGTLNGLLRVRSFRQDDSHNFVTEDQIEEEYKNILDIAELFYGIFGLQYKLRLGTRPDGFLGDIDTWNKAESSLRKILNDTVGEGNYLVAEKDGAFYGPKIDIVMRDSLGRDWQMGTIQLDFQQPARFKLKYTDKDGIEKTPVVVHRVIYGSIERFIGILIEHFAGAFPVWLSPVQVKILPITDRNLAYAKSVADTLRENSIRVEIDERSETLGAKIRDTQAEKVPYMLILGDQEEKDQTVTERHRSGKADGPFSIETFIGYIKKEIEEKELD